MSKIKFDIAGWRAKLLNGADINKPDETGHTALEQAVWANSIRGIKFCLRYGANINQKDKYGNTPLHYSSFVLSMEDMKIMMALIKLGADVNIKNNFEETALHTAVCDTPYEVVKAFIDAGADVNAKDEFGHTILHEASGFNSHPEVIKLLINAGADVNARDKDGETPLMWACFHNENIKIIQTLLDLGADVSAKDNSGATYFDKACWNGNEEVLKFILMRIEDINIRKRYGWNLINLRNNVTFRLILTLKKCNIDVCKSVELSEKIFKNYSYDEIYDKEAVQDFIKHDIKLKISLSTLSNVASAKQRKAKLANLLALVSDINVRDENQNTVLYKFIKNNNFRITKVLIEAGADVNVKNNQGETPLSCAVKYKAKGKIIYLLLAYGAKVDTENKMVQSAVAAFLAQQKNKPSATQLGLFKGKKG